MTSTSHQEILECHQRYNAALAALNKEVPLQVETAYEYFTRASVRVRVVFEKDVNVPLVNAVLHRYNAKALMFETHNHGNCTTAWVYVYRRYSAWGKFVQWALIVVGVTAFSLGVWLILRAEREKGGFGLTFAFGFPFSAFFGSEQQARHGAGAGLGTGKRSFY